MTRSEFHAKLLIFLYDNLKTFNLESESSYEGLGFSNIKFVISTNSNQFDAVLVDDENNEIPIRL